MASVIGRQFDLALLTHIADVSEDAILDAIDEATSAALLAEVPGSPDHFIFNHALIRTTLYEELNSARRARLHRKVGEALEELTRSAPGTRIDELAHHWLNATQVTDAAKAIRYARQAGDQAFAGLAFEEAAAHYERAVAVLEPRDQDGMRLRCDLLLALGDVQRRAGNPSYRETVAKAVEVARALGDGERLALAALGHARPGGMLANVSVVDERLLALYDEASAALGNADSLLRARVLGQLAAELSYTSERERRHECSREAVAIARRLGDPLGLGQALNLRLYAINDPFTLTERLDLTTELAALAARVGSSELAWYAAWHRAGALLESGDIVAPSSPSSSSSGLRASFGNPSISGTPSWDGRCSPSCAAGPTPRQRHSRPSSWAWPAASPMRPTRSAVRSTACVTTTAASVSSSTSCAPMPRPSHTCRCGERCWDGPTTTPISWRRRVPRSMPSVLADSTIRPTTHGRVPCSP